MNGAMIGARQSTCVAISNRAILIEGAPGAGKSSLALALIDRGAMLVGDDSVMLERVAGQLVARPHPATRGLLEVRNLGLLPFAVCDRAPVALMLRLDHEAPRFMETAQATMIGGISVPMIRLWPDSPVLALRAELALSRYGTVAG